MAPEVAYMHIAVLMASMSGSHLLYTETVESDAHTPRNTHQPQSLPQRPTVRQLAKNNVTRRVSRCTCTVHVHTYMNPLHCKQ